MSWNPLKKINRHGSKTHSGAADDILLDKNVPKLETLETSTKKLLKDAKKYEESLVQVNECEKKMTTDLSNSLLCQEEQQLRSLVEEWHTYIAQVASVDDDLSVGTRQTVIDPLKKFQGVFAEAKSFLKKREQAFQECGKMQQKVQKFQEKEKTGPNVVKLEAAKQNLATLEEDFNNQNKVLQTEIPQLYEGRIEYFQPCLEAFLKSQLQHSRDVVDLFQQSMPSLRSFQSDMDFQMIQNQRLSNVQALSIVAE